MTQPFEYDHAISLGGWCQVAAQLRRKSLQVQAAGGNYFFDRLITPLPALHSLLQHGIQNAGYDAYSYGGTAIGLTTGLRYHHEFGRDAYGNCVVTNMAHVHARLSRRWSRLHRLNGKRLLFVRLGGAIGENCGSQIDMDKLPLNARDMDRIADLVGQTFPDSLFRIAWAYFDGRMALQGMPSARCIDVFTFTNLGASPHYTQRDSWVGDDSQWDRMLDRYAMGRATGRIVEEPAA